VIEARAAEPIIPLHVFTSRTFSLASGMSFLLGVAMFGGLTSRRLLDAMSARLPGAHLSAGIGGQLDPVTINRLPAAGKDAAFFAVSHAVDGVFLWAVPAAAVVFVLAWLVKEIPLRGRAEPADEAEPEFAS
jgi:hypothetical protein